MQQLPLALILIKFPNNSKGSTVNMKSQGLVKHGLYYLRTGKLHHCAMMRLPQCRGRARVSQLASLPSLSQEETIAQWLEAGQGDTDHTRPEDYKGRFVLLELMGAVS